jgi:isopropylmalate/homocitrate/citramalate synthase
MMAERVFIYDTTLRDGAQTQGVDFGVADKREAIFDAITWKLFHARADS